MVVLQQYISENSERSSLTKPMVLDRYMNVQHSETNVSVFKVSRNLSIARTLKYSITCKAYRKYESCINNEATSKLLVY